MKSGFKRTISWIKYQLAVATENLNQYLDYLIYPNFHGVNKLFVLSFEYNAHQTSHRGSFHLKVEIKDYNFIIYWQNLLDQPKKDDLRTNDNIQKLR